MPAQAPACMLQDAAMAGYGQCLKTPLRFIARLAPVLLHPATSLQGAPASAGGQAERYASRLAPACMQDAARA